jgi:polyhydroxyalkanoate synthase
MPSSTTFSVLFKPYHHKSKGKQLVSLKSFPTTPVELQDELKQMEENARTLWRVSTHRANVAQTPKQVIWTLNKAKLYRYTPVVPAEKRHKIPLLLVFALMNKPYILDLRPGYSFVEYMVKKGYDVYLIDWGSPGPEDKYLKFDDYVLDYLTRAIRKVKAVSGSEEFSMLGWCIGAILTTIYASLRPEEGLKNLLLLTAPLDFTDKTAGGFVRWVNDQNFDPELIVSIFGNMPGEMIDYGAKALKPVENYIGSYLNLWDNLDNPRVVESWHAMNTWVNDLIPMAGATYKQLINELYKENRLIKGNLIIRGERVDLSHIHANLLNVIATGDHISPPCQSESIMALVGSQDQKVLKVKGGHIGMMAGSGAVKFTWPHIDEWLSARSN